MEYGASQENLLNQYYQLISSMKPFTVPTLNY